jgi:hypothetical protein
MLKDNERAAKYRAEGNELFAQASYCESLLKYNHSLCYAEIGSIDLALGYGNRSAVYLKLKEHELCLKNIQLARDHGYPADKLQKLNERELECKKQMKFYHPHPDSDPLNFFKLSYPANEKLPFFADCLELKINQKYGRHIITNRDLKCGDIIAITDSFFILFDKRARLHHCSNCASIVSKLSLIPCSGCTQCKLILINDAVIDYYT